MTSMGGSVDTRFRTGAFWGGLLGCLGVAGLFLSEYTVLFPLLAFVAAPLAAGFAISGKEELIFRLVFAVTLAFTLELLLGGTGHWLAVFGLSARYLLLFSGLAVGGLYVLLKRDFGFPKLIAGVAIFYGAVLPMLWFTYSVLRGNDPVVVFSDVGFLITLLVYLPLAVVFKRRAVFFNGFLLGTFSILILATLFAPLAPETYASWFAGTVGPLPGTVGPSPGGFPRVSLLTKVFLSMSIAWGILYFADRLQPWLYRLFGLALLTLGTVAVATFFSRSTLGALALVLAFTLVAGLLVPWTRDLRWRVLGASALMVPVVLAVMISMSPGGTARFLYATDEIVSVARSSLDIGEDGRASGMESGGNASGMESGGQAKEQTRTERTRVRMTEALLREWEENPFFGEGMGSSPEDYTRNGKSRTVFELEYHALLYKVGAVGMAVFLLLPIFLAVRYVSLLRGRSNLLRTHLGKLGASALAGSLITAVAGTTNPVLTSAYFSFLVALYLALETGLGEGRKPERG